MRFAQLLGTHVIDAADRSLGRVHDVRLVRDGPHVGSFGATYRIQSLIVGGGAIGTRLGLDRNEIKGPLPLKIVFERVRRDLRPIGWSEIVAIEEETIRLGSVAPEDRSSIRERQVGQPAGETVDAGLRLLDRQIVDRDGLMAGKVDDLELTFPDEPGAPPFVTTILAGPGALAHRFGGNLGLWIDSVQRRLADDPDPAQISFGVVKRIDNHLELSVSREDLDVMRFERWVREHIISRIPGS